MKISICFALVLLGLCTLAAAQKKIQQSKGYERPAFTGAHKGIRPTLYEDYDEILSTMPQLESDEEEIEEELNKMKEQEEPDLVPEVEEAVEQAQEYELSHKQVGLPCGKFFCGLEEDCCNDIVFNKQPVCYNLATHRCVNNIALCGINDRFCNDTVISGKALCYNPQTHKCIRGIALCAIGESLCGRLCYTPSNLWRCSNGQLVSIGGGQAGAKLSKQKERAVDKQKKPAYVEPKKQTGAAQAPQIVPEVPLKTESAQLPPQQKPVVGQQIVPIQGQYNCVGCGIHELCCLDNSVVGRPVCYSPGTHHCLEVGGVKALCAIEDGLCGRICYSPADHRCENGVLMPIIVVNQQKHQRSILESVFSWWK